jgi:hypothetical protein
MNTYFKIGSYVAAAVVAVSAVQWFASYNDKKGYSRAVAEQGAHAAMVSEQFRLQEAADRRYSDEQLAIANQKKTATDNANRSLVADIGGMREREEIYKRKLSSAETDTRTAIAIGAAGYGNYLECRDRYAAMGQKYAEGSDQLNGLIAQVKK